MEQSPWETSSHSAGLEIPCLLWNVKVHYHFEKSLPNRRPYVTFCNKLAFYGEKLLAPHPTPKLEDCNLSAVHDCLFKYIHNCSPHLEVHSILNPKACHPIPVVGIYNCIQSMWELYNVWCCCCLQLGTFKGLTASKAKHSCGLFYSTVHAQKICGTPHPARWKDSLMEWCLAVYHRLRTMVGPDVLSNKKSHSLHTVCEENWLRMKSRPIVHKAFRIKCSQYGVKLQYTLPLSALDKMIST